MFTLYDICENYNDFLCVGQKRSILKRFSRVGDLVHRPVFCAYDESGVVFVNACELTASITAAANVLACNLTEDELTLLGVVLTQLGDTILTIATQRSLCGAHQK